MTDIAFARLSDLPLRDAWAHEAHAFTPWLAANLDHLSDAVGMPLELTGQEVRVEQFAADILARDPRTGDAVLIENQLEQTDHTHLGQIMTYLAGLDARTVIWIAPQFREPHLSAIRWLNENTADGFAFFAVRLRVVRIADSPFAPIFEVVEKPNGWQRQVAAKASTVQGSALGDQRHAFWTTWAERHPGIPNVISRTSNFPTEIDALGGLTVVAWIGRREGGIFLRGRFGESREQATERLAPFADRLEQALGAHAGAGLFEQTFPGSLDDPATWPALIDRQAEVRARYLAALSDLAPELPR